VPNPPFIFFYDLFNCANTSWLSTNASYRAFSSTKVPEARQATSSETERGSLNGSIATTLIISNKQFLFTNITGDQAVLGSGQIVGCGGFSRAVTNAYQTHNI
jgi:hypothetical protein